MAWSRASCRTAKTGEMLMLGFLNETSYAEDAGDRVCHFLEPHPQKLWMKGETSGNRLRVIEASTDCDNDALLFRWKSKAMGWCATRAR